MTLQNTPLSKKDKKQLGAYIAAHWGIHLADKSHTLHDLFVIIHNAGWHIGRESMQKEIKKSLGIN